jgi:hypothetical protein
MTLPGPVFHRLDCTSHTGAFGNFTPSLSQSGHKPLDLSGSCHRTKAAAFRWDEGLRPANQLVQAVRFHSPLSIMSAGLFRDAHAHRKTTADRNNLRSAT